MGSVYINYNELSDSIDESRKARNEISDYVEKLKRRIIEPVHDLPGSDPMTYASTAASLAWSKIGKLNENAGRFSTYEATAANLRDDAKTKDNQVAARIQTVADTILGSRNIFQKVGDAIFNFFCVDLANNFEWSKNVVDTIKKISSKVDSKIEDLMDWFKYGDGKYVGNILKAFGGFILAAGAAIAAVVSLPITGTAAAVIGFVAVVCAVVTMGCTMINLGPTVDANMRSLELSKENPGAARYYGNIDSLSEKYHRTDMGSKGDNHRAKALGGFVDTVDTIAAIGTILCGVANLGVVHDYRYKPTTKGHYTGYEFSFNNIKKNILHDMGIFTSKVGKKDIPIHEKINWKKAIDFKAPFKGYERKKFTLDKVLVIPEPLYHVLNITKIAHSTNKTFENWGKMWDIMYGKETSFDDTVDVISGFGDVVQPVGKPLDPIKDTYSTITDIIEDIKDKLIGDTNPYGESSTDPAKPIPMVDFDKPYLDQSGAPFSSGGGTFGGGGGGGRIPFCGTFGSSSGFGGGGGGSSSWGLVGGGAF